MSITFNTASKNYKISSNKKNANLGTNVDYSQFWKSDDISKNNLDGYVCENILEVKNYPFFNSTESAFYLDYTGAYFAAKPSKLRINKYNMDALLLGSHYASVNDVDKAGLGFVYFNKNGISIKDTPKIIIYGSDRGEKCCIVLEDAGDFNGDGYNDLVVASAYKKINKKYGGCAYILFMKYINIDTDKPILIRADDIGKTVPGLKIEGGYDGTRYMGWCNQIVSGHFESEECSSIAIYQYDFYNKLKEQKSYDVNNPPIKQEISKSGGKTFPPKLYILTGSKNIPKKGGIIKLSKDNYKFNVRTTLIPLDNYNKMIYQPTTLPGISKIKNFPNNFDSLIINLHPFKAYVFFGNKNFNKYKLSTASLCISSSTKDGPMAWYYYYIRFVNSIKNFSFSGTSIVVHFYNKSGIINLTEKAIKKKYLTTDDFDHIILDKEQPNKCLCSSVTAIYDDITNNSFSDIYIDAYNFQEKCINGVVIERGRGFLLEGGREYDKIIDISKQSKYIYLADISKNGKLGFGWTVGKFSSKNKNQLVIGDHYLSNKDKSKLNIGGAYLLDEIL